MDNTPSDLRVGCRFCQSEHIEQLDDVIVSYSVTGWTREPDGTLTPDFDSDGGTVYWDGSDFRGYQCADCKQEFYEPLILPAVPDETVTHPPR